MEFDPYSEAFFEDPWEIYRWLRDEQPVYHHERLGFWAVSRYADCVEVHRDTATFTSTRGVTLDQLRSAAFGAVADHVGSIIMMDPPMHERMRKLVSRAFTPRRIAEWEPVVDRVVGGFLDGLAGAGSFDVVVDLSGPFPVEVICEIVGVPAADRQQIRHWTDAMLEREVGNPFPPPAGIDASIAAHRYMVDLVADKRRQPHDDMIGHLLEAEVEREDGTVERLDDVEVAQFVSLLTAAGAETVTKLVGNGVMTFAEHPDQLARLRAEPGLAGPAVDEVLRWRAPSQYQGRFSAQDRELHGTTVPAGNPVLIVTGAANRDPRAYDEPDRFDIGRTGPLGISFGHGAHYCIGAHLARLEGRVAFTELYRRWPDLGVDLEGVRYVHMANVAGPASVPVST
ncbi:MAG TPA: cytochrome P450 [Acidimicrobiales bacterium]|nr:cytochrome P450 [Acidimicrobiales bacterium]